jgi:hypothetical protein
MFTYEINQRLLRAGNPNQLISVAVHPGYTATNILNGKMSLVEMGNAMLAMDGKSGALSQVLGTPRRSGGVGSPGVVVFLFFQVLLVRHPHCSCRGFTLLFRLRCGDLAGHCITCN